MIGNELGLRLRHKRSVLGPWYDIEYTHRRGVFSRQYKWLKRKPIRVDQQQMYVWVTPIVRQTDVTVTTDDIIRSTTIADPGGSTTLPNGKPGRQPFNPV